MEKFCDDLFCRHFLKRTLFWRMSAHALLVLVIRAKNSYTSYFQKSSQVSFQHRNRHGVLCTFCFTELILSHFI